jgi:hypothetical protein
MNSNLYGKVWDFPQEMRNHMKVCFTKVKDVDANTEGFNRNKRLQSATSIGYPELKRIKNFFDNHSGTNTDAPFILNGENKMKTFVDSILSGARQSLSTTKRNRDQTGTIDKDYLEVPDANVNMNLRKDDSHKNTIAKYDLQVTESLKRINDLMKKVI